MRPFIDFYQKYRADDRFWFAIIFLAAVAVMLPMPLAGLPEGYDVPQHIRFAQAYRDAFLAGQFVPGWAWVDNYGFGAVGVRFYPPLADYLMGLTDIYFRNWYWSFIVNSVFWMIPGCFGIYLWSREFFSREISAMAAVLFAVMPYHLLQVYQYTLFSEFAAAAVLPFCFWSLTRVLKRGNWSDAIVLSISYSLLILGHLPSIITGTIALSVYALFLIDWKRFPATFLRLFVAGSLSLAATSFYWLRLVTEVNWVKHNTQENWSEFFDYSQYLFPIYFSSPEHLYWERIFWLLDTTSLLTFAVFVPIVLCLLAARFRGNLPNAKLIYALAGTGIVLLLMMSIPGKLVWQNVPVLYKIQFPWRFLSPMSVIAVMAFAAAVPLFYKEFVRSRRLVSYFVIILVSGILVFDVAENILPMAPSSEATFSEKYANLNNSEACECWWPAWADRTAFANRDKVVASGRGVQISQWDGDERRFTIDAGEPTSARPATFFYPHWKATVNGVGTSVEKNTDGTMAIPIPAERSEVRLYFEEPWFLGAAKYVSLLAWIITGLAFIPLTRRRRSAQLPIAAVAQGAEA